MICAQVILSPNINWLPDFIASAVGKKVSMRFFPHVQGDTTKARLDAFGQMDGEWLTWLDCDDEIGDGWNSLSDACGDGVGMVFGDEVSIRHNGSTCGNGPMFGEPASERDVWLSPRIAHKCIFHRNALPIAKEIIGDRPYGIEWALAVAGTLVGKTVKVNETAYRWRKHPDQASRFRELDHHGLTESVERVVRMYGKEV